MYLDDQLEIILSRLDRIEKTLTEIQAKSCISVDEFEQVKSDIGRVSAIAMCSPRDKGNTLPKR